MQNVTPQDGQSADIVSENIEKLKELFPDAFTEEGVNFDVLRQLLGDADVLDEGEEKYGLNWHGKKAARQIALTPSSGTLLPKPESSVEWDETNNLFIEGDNLEVLKLLQKSYAGKVDIIYIDPPYNTDNDFVYPDKFSEGLETYLRYTGQKTDDGSWSVSESGRDKLGRRHSNWLDMMLPRIKLAKNLLSNEGIVCVSISDIELANLRLILDDVFGAENFINIANILAKVAAGASGGGEDKRLKKNIEYVLIYAKNIGSLGPLAHLYKAEPLIDVVNGMREAGESWKYTSILLGADDRDHLGTIEDGDGNPIEIFKRKNVQRTTIKKVMSSEGLSEEEAYAKYLSSTFSDTNAQTSIRSRVIDFVGDLEDGEMLEVEYVPRSGKDKGQMVTHSYVSRTVRRVIWLRDVADLEDGRVIKKERLGTHWDHFDYNNVGKEGGVPFPEGKKPIGLIEQCLEIVANKDALVLDFFAGSGSTAHAVFSKNASDLGKRNFICVQLPEPISKKKEYDAVRQFAVDNGLEPIISEISKERIRRAGAEHKFGANDVGFKVFELKDSNIRAWNPNRADLEETLLSHKEHLVEGRSEQDLLYELLLKRGIQLTVPIEERQAAGKTIHSIGYGVLFACLDTSIAAAAVDDVAQGILDWHKELAPETDTHVFFRDSAFADDIAKTNMAAILEQNGISHVRSL